MKAYTRYFRATSFAVLTVTLVGLIAILVVLLVLVLDAAEEAQAPQKRSLLMMAYLALGALGLASLLLVVLAARFLGSRVTERMGDRKPMGYVDAWAEAGRRLKPEDAPPIEGFEDGDPDSSPPADSP